MIKLIDDKGRFFGKVNVIDFLAALSILVLIPGFYTAQKFMREFFDEVKLYNETEAYPFYAVKRKCPNCEEQIGVKIRKGRLASEAFPAHMECPYCKIEVTLEF